MNPQLKEQDSRYHQQCKVVMLPTEKASKFHKHEELSTGCEFMGWFQNLKLTTKDVKMGDYDWYVNTPQHLYFTNDEEIKEGDYFLDDQRIHTSDNNGKPDYKVSKCEKVENGWIIANSVGCNPGWSKKIIATTDESIGLPKPSASFINKYIEEYNKGNVITNVLVEYEYKDIAQWARGEDDTYDCFTCGKKDFYREDDCNCQFYYLKVDSNNQITIKKVKDTWTTEEMEGLIRLAMQSKGYTPEQEVQDFIKEHL